MRSYQTTSWPLLLAVIGVVLILWALIVCGMSWLLMLVLGWFGVTVKYWQAIVIWVVVSALLGTGKVSAGQ